MIKPAVKVSVVIPVYNRVKLISRAIDSVLAQSYQDFEVIVVDDGSTDGTGKIVRKYVEKNPDKIRYVYQSRNNAAAARNKGIRHSNGQYIAFLDSDDLWYPQKLEKQVKKLEQDNLDLVHTNRELVDFTKGKRGLMLPMLTEFAKSGKDLLASRAFIAMTVLIRKSVLSEVGLFDEALYTTHDTDLWLKIAKKHKIGFIDDELVISCKYHDSLAIKCFEQKYKDRLAIIKRILMDDHPWIVKENWQSRYDETVDALQEELAKKGKKYDHLLKSKLESKILLDETDGTIKSKDHVPLVKNKLDLWVVRHGQTDANNLEKKTGYKNYAGDVDESINLLNKTGIKEAHMAADRLFELIKDKLDGSDEIVIISSQLSRAKDTAQIFIDHIFERTGKRKNKAMVTKNECLFKITNCSLRLIYDKRLNEISFGDWTNKSLVDLPQYEIDMWRWAKKTDVTTTPKNGENFLSLIVRLKEAMDEYNNRFKGQMVVLFTHAIVLNAIRVILLHESILGNEGELYWRSKGFHHAQPVQIAYAEK